MITISIQFSAQRKKIKIKVMFIITKQISDTVNIWKQTWVIDYR